MYDAAQRRVLGALGIELWVRRARAAPERAHDLPGGAAVHAALDAPPEAPADERDLPGPAASSTAALSLTLVGLRSAGVLVIGELPLGEDRRFARDVLGAVAGATAAEPEVVPFSWPQSSRGDQGRDAAGQALEAFLRGQVERAGVRTLVIFGGGVRQLLFPNDVGSECVIRFAGIHGVLTATTEELRNSVERKRDLWHTLLTVPIRA